MRHSPITRENMLELIERARESTGSYNKLAAAMGISRRRLGYLLQGDRTAHYKSGPVRIKVHATTAEIELMKIIVEEST